MKVTNILREQFEYDFEADLADIKKSLKVVEVHVHENGLVALTINKSTDTYVLCIRTPGFRGAFEYADPRQMMREWQKAKTDLESGGYGPWGKDGSWSNRRTKR